METEIQQKIEQLQNMEHNLQHLTMQKQTIQSQLLEIGSALEALKSETKRLFKIVGAIMIESTHEEIVKDLKEKQIGKKV